MKSANHIYLDYSATTPVDPEVLSVIVSHSKKTFGNASSVHALGRTAKVILEESRDVIARAIGAEPSELFFTSGGTESDNHSVLGSALAQRRLRGRNHVIVSAIEHHAVLHCAEYLRSMDFSVSLLPVDVNGIVQINKLEGLISTETGIISVMHANNEIGTVQPVADIALLAHTQGIIVHTDAVQSFGKIPVNMDTLGVDLLSLSAHKIYGPKGIGAIYIRKGTNVDALLHGGSQERKHRAGTENIPLIAGFAKAVELAEANREKQFKRISKLKEKLKTLIVNAVPGVVFNGDVDDALPHILNVSLDSSLYTIESESLLLNMDLHGVAVSSGSACTSGSVQPSHVLTAMGRDLKTTQATIRFSFGTFTTMKEVVSAGNTFVRIVKSLQEQSR